MYYWSLDMGMYVYTYACVWLYTCLHEHGTQIWKDIFRLLTWGGNRKYVSGVWNKGEAKKYILTYVHYYNKVDGWWRSTI